MDGGAGELPRVAAGTFVVSAGVALDATPLLASPTVAQTHSYIRGKGFCRLFTALAQQLRPTTRKLYSAVSELEQVGRALL